MFRKLRILYISSLSTTRENLQFSFNLATARDRFVQFYATSASMCKYGNNCVTDKNSAVINLIEKILYEHVCEPVQQSGFVLGEIFQEISKLIQRHVQMTF